MPFLASKFEEFLKAATPAGTTLPESSIGALRSTFYAGATILFFGISGELSPGPDCQPVDEHFMRNLHDELEAYALECRSKGAPNFYAN